MGSKHRYRNTRYAASKVGAGLIEGPLYRPCIPWGGNCDRTGKPNLTAVHDAEYQCGVHGADAHVTVVDVLAFVGGFQIASAGEFGHALLSAALAGRQFCPTKPKEMAPARRLHAEAVGGVSQDGAKRHRLTIQCIVTCSQDTH